MPRRARRIIRWTLAALLLLVGYALYGQLRSSESHRLANVSWQRSGRRMQAQIMVVDANDQPVAGANVNIDNDSGGNSTDTDSQGVAVIQLGESEMKGVDLNGVRIVNRPLASYIGWPNVDKGIVMTIKLKAKE